MARDQRIPGNLGLDDWVLGFTGIAAVAIGILDFIGWLHLTTDQLLEMATVGLGLLMSAVVIQAKRQKTGLANLGNELEKSISGQLDVRRFTKVEYGVEYIATRFLTSRNYIDHASLSPPVPRWFRSSGYFEQAVEEVVLSNAVKVRYLANFSDEGRVRRVRKLLVNPKVNRYLVSSIDWEGLSVPMMNFIVLDDEEVIIATPGLGEADSIIAIRNQEIVSAFERYFNLLWAKATLLDGIEAIEAHAMDNSE
jgi:hypothetical protein